MLYVLALKPVLVQTHEYKSSKASHLNLLETQLFHFELEIFRILFQLEQQILLEFILTQMKDF